MPQPPTGAMAEAFAAGQLEARGWEILARNLRTPAGEVDILARAPGPADEVLVVVEVKARHPLAWATGEDALRPIQRARLRRALEWCARRLGWQGMLRVDVAAVECVAGEATAFQLVEGVETGLT